MSILFSTSGSVGGLGGRTTQVYPAHLPPWELERSNELIHDLGAHALVLTIFFIILMQIFR